MGEAIGQILLFVVGFFVIGFVIIPILGTGCAIGSLVGFDTLWNGMVWLWDVHWALPFLVVLGIPTFVIGTVFG